MNIKSQFALSCISRAIDAAEEVLPLFEKKYPKDDRPRKAIVLTKQWLSLIQQGKEAQAKQMGGQLRNAAHAAADSADAAHAASAVSAAYAASYSIAATNAAIVSEAGAAVAYAEDAKGGDWYKAMRRERQWQKKEAAKLINASKGEILWKEDAAIFLIGKMNLEMWKNNIQMIEAREALL